MVISGAHGDYHDRLSLTVHKKRERGARFFIWGGPRDASVPRPSVSPPPHILLPGFAFWPFFAYFASEISGLGALCTFALRNRSRFKKKKKKTKMSAISSLAAYGHSGDSVCSAEKKKLTKFTGASCRVSWPFQVPWFIPEIIIKYISRIFVCCIAHVFAALCFLSIFFFLVFFFPSLNPVNYVCFMCLISS